MTSAWTLKTFIDSFPYELFELRGTAHFENYPAEPSFFIDLAEQVFPSSPTSQVPWKVHAPYVSPARFVQILREFLYHDGRSFESLLLVAERECEAPVVYECHGVNALAGIACYLRNGGGSPIAEDRLLATLRRLATNPNLRHNSRVCAKLLLEQRPDLGGRYTDFPDKGVLED